MKAKAGFNHVIVEPIGSNDIDAVAGLVIQEYAEPFLIRSCLGIVRSVGPIWCGAKELSELPKRVSFRQMTRAQRINDISLAYDVPCEVKEGDIVLFKYLANIDEDADLGTVMVMRYDWLLARVDGPEKLYPLNGCVFLEMSDEVVHGGGLYGGTTMDRSWGKVVAQGAPVARYLYWPKSPGDDDTDLLGAEVCFRKGMAVRMEHDAYRLLFANTQYPLYYIHRLHINAYIHE